MLRKSPETVEDALPAEVLAATIYPTQRCKAITSPLIHRYVTDLDSEGHLLSLVLFATL